MLLADAHVHFHPCFDREQFLNAAAKNLRSAASALGCVENCVFMLWLTETSQRRWFQELKDLAHGKENTSEGSSWKVDSTAEDFVLRIRHAQFGEILIVAGQQIVTAEQLEVLGLGTVARIDDGLPIRDTLTAVADSDALPVLPWGFGKWLGKRGKLIKHLLRETEGGTLFLGDNSSRLARWPAPKEFALAARRRIRILPGTDPLPFASEVRKVGSFGFLADCSVGGERPATQAKTILRDSRVQITPYGGLESPVRFFRNQIAMQWTKRSLTQ